MAPKNGGFEWQPEASETLASLLEVENTHAVIRSEPECPLAFVELFASDGEVSNGKYFFKKNSLFLDFGDHRYPDLLCGPLLLRIFS